MSGALASQLARAENPFTLKCSGARSWVTAGHGDTHPSDSERVTDYYTFSLDGATAEVYGWHEHAWRLIRASDAQTYRLEEQRQGMNWQLTIGRSDGAWSETWSASGRTISITGSCTRVALRKPPAAPPTQ